MPITRGISCAYCGSSFQSDYQMEIHRRNNHKEEIKKAENNNNAERDRIRRNQEVY